MQPSSVQLLRAVVANLEELVIPQLEGDHARSAAECARMVVNHVILRLEGEGEVLGTDNAEKRLLLAGLATTLEAGRTTAGADLAAMVRSELEALPATMSYVSMDRLTMENDTLKEVLEQVIIALHEAAQALGRVEGMRSEIRAQLRAQLDRETSLVVPAMDRPPF
jgi:hypothetical protein